MHVNLNFLIEYELNSFLDRDETLKNRTSQRPLTRKILSESNSWIARLTRLINRSMRQQNVSHIFKNQILLTRRKTIVWRFLLMYQMTVSWILRMKCCVRLVWIYCRLWWGFMFEEAVSMDITFFIL